MVRIRLSRTGLKHQPTYRIMVADVEAPRDGRFIENIGSYNPRTEPPTIEIKDERLTYWMGVGAKPSDSLMRILKFTGVLERIGYTGKVGKYVEPAAAEAESKPAKAARK